MKLVDYRVTVRHKLLELPAAVCAYLNLTILPFASFSHQNISSSNRKRVFERGDIDALKANPGLQIRDQLAGGIELAMHQEGMSRWVLDRTGPFNQPVVIRVTTVTIELHDLRSNFILFPENPHTGFPVN
jgi:hypothetical protein